MAGSFSSLFAGVTEKLDKHVGWHRMPLPLGMLTLIGLRDRLREKNLYDTGRGALDVPEPADDRYLTARTLDGTYNDLDDPLMGSLRQPVRAQRPARLHGPASRRQAARAEPARSISRELLTRDEFQPATTLNLLAGRVDPVRGSRLVQPRQGRAEEAVGGPARGRRPVAGAPDADPADAARSELRSGRAADVRHRRHALVGRLADLRQRRQRSPMRSGRRRQGKLKIDETGLPPDELETHIDLTGVGGNFWVGLALLHSLFMREHNAVCDHLHAQLSGARRPGAVRQGAARHRGADGEDPHRRLDAGDHRAPDDGARAARELVGPRGRAARQALRPADLERGDARDPGLADGPPRRALLADRGVRRRLPDAPADPGRFQLPLDRGRPRAAGARRSRSSARSRCASG